MGSGRDAIPGQVPAVRVIGEFGIEAPVTVPQDTGGAALALIDVDGVLSFGQADVVGGYYEPLSISDPDDPDFPGLYFTFDGRPILVWIEG